MDRSLALEVSARAFSTARRASPDIHPPSVLRCMEDAYSVKLVVSYLLKSSRCAVKILSFLFTMATCQLPLAFGVCCPSGNGVSFRQPDTLSIDSIAHCIPSEHEATSSPDILLIAAQLQIWCIQRRATQLSACRWLISTHAVHSSSKNNRQCWR